MPPTTEESNYLADFDDLDDGLDSPVSQDEPQDNEEIKYVFQFFILTLSNVKQWHRKRFVRLGPGFA